MSYYGDIHEYTTHTHTESIVSIVSIVPTHSFIHSHNKSKQASSNGNNLLTPTRERERPHGLIRLLLQPQILHTPVQLRFLHRPADVCLFNCAAADGGYFGDRGEAFHGEACRMCIFVIIGDCGYETWDQCVDEVLAVIIVD